MNSHIGVTLRVMKNRVFSDGNGSSVKNLSCGWPRHFPHQPNLQVCLLLSRILSRNQLFVCSGRSLRAPCRSTGSWTRTEGWGFPTLVTPHRPTSRNFIILNLILKTKNRLWSWFSQTDGQTGVAQRHYASNHRLARWTMIMMMKSLW